jgi:nucleotide sugar dehydrogenase
MTSLREQLKQGTRRVGIWGLGYLGFSSMAHFARDGVSCIGTDPLEERAEDVNRGRTTIPSLDMWLGFDTQPLAGAGLMRATTDWKELVAEDIAVHLVAVPTERMGEPYDEPLRDVVEKLVHYRQLSTDAPPLIVIESTVTPRKVDELVVPVLEAGGLRVGHDVLVGVAPRRDWFISPEKTLKTLPRIIGGTTPETTALMAEVLGIVTDHILKASDHRHAEMVKSVENAYRHMDIALATQLSLAYPDLDVREVLRLVGTKWNMETYYPSFGTGGYCIPLAPQYVIEGAVRPEELTLLKAALAVDREQPIRVARSLIRRDVGRVGVLGFAYKGDLKVHTLTPALPILRELWQAGVVAKVHDPYFTLEELRRYCDPSIETFPFPEGLREFDAVLIVADHTHYRLAKPRDILKNLTRCRLILDNVGVWRDLPLDGIEYRVAGNRGWLGDV